MKFNLYQSIEILERIPFVIESMLAGVSDEWVINNEGGISWSPYMVVGHLIHGERTDWMVRLDVILGDKKDKTFVPFDRQAQFTQSEGKSLNLLLDEFKVLRKKNLEKLRKKNITEEMLNKTGIHPDLGIVTLRNLLATWVVHDLGHVAQIARVMAKQYKSEVGKWDHPNYMPVLTR